MWKFVFSSKLQLTRAGFNISISVAGVISDAFISPGPFASKTNFFVPSEEHFNANDLTFKTISVTSSLTPLIDVNSCNTPSICIDVTAAPLIDDNNILLREFPKVKPKPFSSGSATIVACVKSSVIFTSKLALDNGMQEKINCDKNLVAVKNCRCIGKKEML